jgi:DNA-binding LytR/AlgR family response regulator
MAIVDIIDTIRILPDHGSTAIGDSPSINPWVVRVPLIYRSLTAIEQRLNPAAFFPENRSQIINLHCVESVENEIDGRLVVKLTESRQVEISPLQSRRLRELLSL